MEQVIRVPLFNDIIEPYQYKRLCSLFNKQIKEVAQDAALQITAIELERDNKLDELFAAQNAVNKIFSKHYQVCPECSGEGTITDYTDMYDDRGHSIKCVKCNGAGYLKKENE